jgi:transcriptional regulator with XRE-family HTH domain
MGSKGEISMAIAEEIKSKREQLGLSQEELAEQVGVSR